MSGLPCNIRATILQQTSLVATQTAANGCTVTYGSWVDPYSGATLTGNPYQGDGTANDLDIDHIIPLKYVNSHGGYSWSASDKKAYGKSITAMNNGVYLVVSASENRKKGDSGPADYYPSNPDFSEYDNTLNEREMYPGDSFFVKIEFWEQRELIKSLEGWYLVHMNKNNANKICKLN